MSESNTDGDREHEASVANAEAQKQHTHHAAEVKEHKKEDAALDEQLKESFPGSDPPSTGTFT